MNKHGHPYIPNSLPAIKQEMMQEIGVKSIDELYADIPEKYRLKKLLNLPEALSEFEVKKHVEALLSKNRTYSDISVFLGAGCWPHYVPAVVKNIAAFINSLKICRTAALHVISEAPCSGVIFPSYSYNLSAKIML